MKKKRWDASLFWGSMLKIIRVMKLVSFFLLVGFLQVSANIYSQTANIYLSLKETALIDVIKEIQKQTEFTFFYSSEDVNGIIVSEVELEKASLEQVLDLCLKGTNLEYEIVHKAVILKKALVKKTIIDFPKELAEQQPQKKELKGKVTDSKGEPVPGATIIVKGTTLGTITDFEGKFAFQVPVDAKTLVISFVGYKAIEMTIGSNTTFNVVMEAMTVGVDEVIVVGYGTQTKASVVGAISSVKVDEMKTIATSNLTNSIGGHVSGVITRMGEGKPGSDDASIFIRGRATTNSTDPLVLVDGIESDFARINPNDIESFSVLKDASATAVYGVRGANGVILITTKRGNVGRPKIEVNSQVRLHQVIKYPELLNSYDYARLYNEAYLNARNSSKFFSDEDLAAYRDHTDPYNHPDVNWFKALTKPFYMEHRHDISIRGGTEKVKYYVSGEFVSQDGAYKQWEDQRYNSNSTYDRINIRMNFDFEITKTTNLNLSVSNRIENTNDVRSGTIGEVSTRVGLWDEIIGIAPNVSPLNNPDGSFGYLIPFTGGNPYVALRQGGFQKGRINFLQASFKLNQKLDFITPGLTFRMMGGLNTSSRYTYTLTETPAVWHYDPIGDTYTQISRPYLSSISVGDDNIYQLYHIETALNYEKTIAQKHKITALAVYNQDRRINKAEAPVNHLGAAGRLTYGYDNKYLGEINVGYNGSDQFQKGQRFAFLPAASLGWVVSEENFWKEHIPFVKYMKLRGSYGTAGNDKLGSFSYLYKSVYNRKTANNIAGGYYFGETAAGVYGISEGSLGNDHVTWEIAVKQNYGVDFNLLDDLGFSIDYFKEKRSNILTQRNTITDVFGVPASALPPENIGRVENKGMEFEARYNKQFNGWGINLNGNISYARNKIIDIDEVIQIYDYMNKTDKPIGQQFGYLWSGEFYSYEELGYVWDESVEKANKYVLPEGAVPLVPVPLDKVNPGELKFVDRNSDGVIDSYDSGAVKKSGTPEFIYGLNMGVNYKRLSFQMFWQGAGGFSVNFGQSALLTEFKNGGPVHEKHLGRWAYFPEEGIDTREIATYPVLMFNGAPQTQKSSSFKMYDCNYIRLKNVEISYSLPDRMVKPLKMEYAKVYITGSNLLTLDNIGFFDPELPGSGAAYPQSIFYGVGINVGF